MSFIKIQWRNLFKMLSEHFLRRTLVPSFPSTAPVGFRNIIFDSKSSSRWVSAKAVIRFSFSKNSEIRVTPNSPLFGPIRSKSYSVLVFHSTRQPYQVSKESSESCAWNWVRKKFQHLFSSRSLSRPHPLNGQWSWKWIWLYSSWVHTVLLSFIKLNEGIVEYAVTNPF